MTCPPPVVRGLRRVGAGFLATLLVMGGGSWALSLVRLGATPAATRARVEAEVAARLDAHRHALLRATAKGADGARVDDAANGSTDAIRGLFADLPTSEQAAAAGIAALTIYGADEEPLAWTGRPSTLPPGRLSGPPASFFVASSLGLRLVRLQPITQAAGTGRRLGAMVAEAELSPFDAMPEGLPRPVRLPGGLVPVTLGLAAPAAGDANAFAVVDGDGRPLGTAYVSPTAITDARAHWWGQVAAWTWLAAAWWLALLTVPLLDWRAMVRSHAAFLSLTGAAIVSAGVAWACVTRALAAAGLRDAPMGHALQLLATALLVAGAAALAVGTGERWRAVWAGARTRRQVGHVVAALVTGLLLGVLAVRHDRIVDAVVPEGAVRMARAVVEPAPLVSAGALMLLHAGAFGLFLTLAHGLAYAVSGPAPRRHRRTRTVLMAVAALAAAWWSAPRLPTVWTALPLIAAALVMAGTSARARRILRRGSQPARLLVLFVALVVPAVSAYPSLAAKAALVQRQAIEQNLAPQVVNQRGDLQLILRDALAEIDTLRLAAERPGGTTPAAGPPPTEAAFRVWSGTSLSRRRLTSSVELYDSTGRVVSRFAMNLPESTADQAWQETKCQWELFEEVSPFFAEERRLLHAGRAVCEDGRPVGSVVVHVVLDYSNLPFLAAQNPYVGLFGGVDAPSRAVDEEALGFVVYGWSRRPLFVSGGDAWPLSEALYARLAESRAPFWAEIDDRGFTSDVYLQNDRGAIYAIGAPRTTLLAHAAAVAEQIALAGVVFVLLLGLVTAASYLAGQVPWGRAALRQVRASFYRTLFLAFVAAVAVPVVALALVTRAYMTASLYQDIEREATRTVLSASRVVEDFATIESSGATSLPALDDSLLVWLSRVIGEDINVFAGTGLLASSERNLFASGLLPTRTPGELYRALTIEGRPTYIARDVVGDYQYLVASAPVRVDDQQAIVSVPLTLRQRGIERQVAELDRRVLLAAIAFILLGSAIGYWAAERISNPVSRLTRATRRLAAGELDARVLVRTNDELGRLVEAFNGMADDLRRQRGQLERTNRLEAWADMARQVAHDIKNPLTPIQLNAEHLRRVHLDRGQPLGPLVDDCVSNILLQVRLLRQLSSEFSSFASSPEARPAATVLAPLFDEILAPYATALAGRITVEYAVEQPDVTAMVDRLLLARALTNVVENALHAMPGGGRLDVRARAPQDGMVRIDVADSGVGMNDEALARIFEPYFSTKATGTGLGLTIARRNVELNRGRISVTSAPGIGTTVSLWVPVA